jgi:hypothetical protein
MSFKISHALIFSQFCCFPIIDILLIFTSLELVLQNLSLNERIHVSHDPSDLRKNFASLNPLIAEGDDESTCLEEIVFDYFYQFEGHAFAFEEDRSQKLTLIALSCVKSEEILVGNELRPSKFEFD